MATIKSFEDIESWRKARDVCKILGQIIDGGKFKRSYRLIHQVEGSSGSIMDNIAEGFGRGSRLEFIAGLNISRGETDELKSQLYRGKDNRYFSEEQFNEFYALADEVTKMNTSLITYQDKSKIKGQRFKQS